MPKHTPQTAAILRRYKAGYFIVTIAGELDISTAEVRQKLLEAGLSEQQIGGRESNRRKIA